MANNELLQKSITELAGLLKNKDVSPVEVLDAQLRHIEAVDSQINAYISVRADAALDEAQRAEQEIGAGEYKGVLHGIPIAPKDIMYLANEVTTVASRIHKDFVSNFDATVIKKLRQAGVVMPGKLNLHEYAWGCTNNSPHFGPVHNPWDLDKIPGGSSGGSGAAVVANMTFGSLGTDTAGSIRIPSAVCGAVGLKPTFGRVSKYGCFPLAWTLDHVGPITKTVADAAALLQTISGYDANDPMSIDTPVYNYSAGLSGDVSDLVIGVNEDFYFKDIDNEIDKIIRQQIQSLADRGARIETVEIPGLQHSEWAEYATSLAEASTIHHHDLINRPDDFGDDIRFLFELGELFSAVDYLQAQQMRKQIKQDFNEVFQKVDVLVAPTLPVMPPEIGASQADLNGEKVDLIDAFTRLAGPGNLTGLPALSVPAGMNAGMPVGLQVIGPAFDEATVLRVGAAVEQTDPLGTNKPVVC